MQYVYSDKISNQLINSMNQSTIKILVGVRRCGKTTILDQFRSNLSVKKIPQVNSSDQLWISLENELCNPEYLLQFILDRLSKHQMNYIFLDKVEVVPSLPRVVNAPNSLSNTDIYITSSNKTILRKKIFNKWFLILSSRFPLQLPWIHKKEPTRSWFPIVISIFKWGRVPLYSRNPRSNQPPQLREWDHQHNYYYRFHPAGDPLQSRPD